MTHTTIRQRHCSCCQQPYLARRTCGCTATRHNCGKCRAHCRCGQGAQQAAHTSSKNMYYVKSRMLVLTCVKSRSIMNVVGSRPTKGGCCDYYGGILHSRGGSNRTEIDSLHGQGNATQQRNAWAQVRDEVAYQQGRVRGVEKTETQPVRFVSGKLSSSSVARCDSLAIGTRQQTAVRPRYLVAYFSRFVSRIATNHHTNQRFDGQEVAAREGKPL